MSNMEDKIKSYFGELILRVIQLESENEQIKKDNEDYKKELERISKELEDVKKVIPIKSNKSK